MAEISDKCRRPQRYRTEFPHRYRVERVLDESLPPDTIVQLETKVQVHLLRLNTEEQSTVLDTNEWFQEFLRKDKQRNELEKLRRSFQNAAGFFEAIELEVPSVASDSDKPFEQLSRLLQHSPTEAASVILAGLTDSETEHTWRRSLVFAAELVRFTETQDRQLIPALLRFVEQSRDSNCREDQIAVCAAIRTCVGSIPASELESLATILEPGHRASPSSDLLLEIAKMIARKAAANPPADAAQYPRLSEQLVRLANAHLNPYVLPNGKNAAVAMNATLAAIGLASPDGQELLRTVNENCPLWFRQQLRRRLEGLLTGWISSLNDAVAEDETVTALRACVDRVCVN